MLTDAALRLLDLLKPPAAAGGLLEKSVNCSASHNSELRGLSEVVGEGGGEGNIGTLGGGIILGHWGGGGNIMCELQVICKI